MGEVVLKQRLAEAGIDAHVDSVGVSNEESGNPIDRRAASVLAKAGYDVPKRRAQKVTKEQFESADLVVAMTVGHAKKLAELADRYGLDKTKIHLWREFDGTIETSRDGVFGAGGVLEEDGLESGYSALYSSDGDYDVPDPWYGPESGFDNTLDVVERGAEGIVTALNKKN